MASTPLLIRTTSELVRETLEGVDIEEFFKEDEEKVPRKRVRRVIMDEEDDIQEVALPSSPPSFQPHSGSPLRPINKWIGLQSRHCHFNDILGQPEFHFLFMPCQNGKAIEIMGDTLRIKDWIKRRFSAKWDSFNRAWIVQLSDVLTYESLVFRIEHACSRTWKDDTQYNKHYFDNRFPKATFNLDLNRDYDEKEAELTKKNRDLCLKKSGAQPKDRTRYSNFPFCDDHDVCTFCGYDFFYHHCPDKYPTECFFCLMPWQS